MGKKSPGPKLQQVSPSRFGVTVSDKDRRGGITPVNLALLRQEDDEVEEPTC